MKLRMISLVPVSYTHLSYITQIVQVVQFVVKVPNGEPPSTSNIRNMRRLLLPHIFYCTFGKEFKNVLNNYVNNNLYITEGCVTLCDLTTSRHWHNIKKQNISALSRQWGK